jgi:hypothetical protein
MRAASSSPVRPGISMSDSNTSGRSRRSNAPAARPSGAAHHLDVGLQCQQRGQRARHHALVFGDDHAGYSAVKPRATAAQQPR